jgi:hypothetical protein
MNMTEQAQSGSPVSPSSSTGGFIVRNLNFKSSSTSVKRILFSVLAVALLCVPLFGQHIHQLFYNNADWTDSDLTSLAGGPVVYPQGVAAFYTTPLDQFHVYYASNGDFHVHQLFYNGNAWADSDLTALTGGAVASNSAGMSGFSFGDAQYLYFCSSDFSLHEYSYGNNGNFNWVDTELPVGGFNGTCGFAPVGIVAYMTADTARHIYYEAQSSQTARTIHHLYYSPKKKKWLRQNLTALSHGAKAESGTWLSGFNISNTQYVYFQSTNGHIHEYSNVTTNVATWTDQDLTVLGSGVVSSSFEGSGTAAFVVPGTTQKEVFYSGGTAHELHQLEFKTTWKDADLTTLTGGGGPVSLSQVTGFVTTPNNQLHVYLGGIGENAIEQMFYNGTSWASEELPSVAPAGLGPGIAGFSLGNLQYVYYISAN